MFYFKQNFQFKQEPAKLKDMYSTLENSESLNKT